MLLRTLKVKWNIITIHNYHSFKTSKKENRTLWLHISLGGSSEERKVKVLSHSSPKIKILLVLPRYNFNQYFLQWLIRRMTCKANWQKPQHFTTSYKPMSVFQRRGCRDWFSSKIPPREDISSPSPRSLLERNLWSHSCAAPSISVTRRSRLGASCPEDRGLLAPTLRGQRQKGCSDAFPHVVAPCSRHSDTSACLSGTNVLLGLIN